MGGGVLLALALVSCFAVIDVTEYGVFTRFGRVTRVVREPGLRLKLPYPLETVTRLNKRLLAFAPPTIEYLTADKKNLVMHSLVTWRIEAPARFLATVASRTTAQARLSDLVLTMIGIVVGRHPSSALISVNGQESEFNRVMEQIVSRAHVAALADYGVDLVEIRLAQITLPDQNRASVFGRMQAERGRMAMTYRSAGEREFKKLVGEADREKTRIMAEAYRQAEITKAEGDAQAMRIFADAFRKNPQFYKFRRTLQAYEKILDGSTTVFLPADAQVFQILKDSRVREPAK